MDRFEAIPLEQIEWIDSIRGEISQKDIDDMARSFLASDQIEPIVVEEIGARKYRGVVGRLRYEGARRARKSSIYARVHSFVDNGDRKAWQLIENLVRRDLNPLAIGEGYKAFKEYCEKDLGGKHDKDILGAMKKKIYESSGAEGSADKTIWQYIQFAEEIPEDVKAILKSLTRQSFGTRHAIQLLRLKDDHNTMLDYANKIKDEKLTSAQLKALIDDLFKVEEKALKRVKEALKKEEIDLRSAAAISEAQEAMQEPILKMAKQGLKPAEVKKVVDFTIAHQNRAEEVLSRPADEAVAIAEGKSVLKTREEVEAFFRGLRGLAKTEDFEIPCDCPNCTTHFKRKITVVWEDGEVTWGS